MSAKNKPPTPAMLELLEAMKRGVKVHQMARLDGNTFRADTMKGCAAQVHGLLARGLVVRVNADWRGCQFVPKEQVK